jgi:hypothetical protein
MAGNVVATSTDVRTGRTGPSQGAKLITPLYWLPHTCLHGRSPPGP